MNSLGENAAEERDVKPQVLRQRVEAAHGSEVNQAVGRLLAVLNWNASCGVWEKKYTLDFANGDRNTVTV